MNIFFRNQSIEFNIAYPKEEGINIKPILCFYVEFNFEQSKFVGVAEVTYLKQNENLMLKFQLNNVRLIPTEGIEVVNNDDILLMRQIEYILNENLWFTITDEHYNEFIQNNRINNTNSLSEILGNTFSYKSDLRIIKKYLPTLVKDRIEK